MKKDKILENYKYKPIYSFKEENGFIKGGIITRIDIIKNESQAVKYIEKHFNTNLLEKLNKSFSIRQNILIKNLINYRKELLNITENNGDSLNNHEAYTLGEIIDKLLKEGIYLTKDNKKYYFNNKKEIQFETEFTIKETNKFKIIIYFIPIIWDINRIIIEDSNFLSLILNNLTKKALTNPLKDITWFTVSI